MIAMTDDGTLDQVLIALRRIIRAVDLGAASSRLMTRGARMLGSMALVARPLEHRFDGLS